MLKNMNGNENAEHVADLLYSWATEMSSKNKFAHVVFVSDDVFSTSSLRKRMDCTSLTFSSHRTTYLLSYRC